LLTALELPPPFRMRAIPTLLLLTFAVAGCGGGAPTEVRQRIAWFHERANAGRFDEITREQTPSVRPFDKYMRRRTELGRMIRSTEMVVEDVTGYFRVVTVHQDTEFERGHAIETFVFRMDRGLRLSSYHYQVGKRVWCPVITLSPRMQCKFEDAPATLNASR
jgi:hypothetical protein